MNIVVISQYWHPDMNIPERRWQWLTRLLIENGHSVTVIAPPPHSARASQSEARPLVEEIGPCGETILRTKYLPLGHSILQRSISQASVGLYSLLRALGSEGLRNSRRPDLIIGTVPALPTAPVTQLIAKILRVPYVIDLRDAWPDLLRQARQWNEGVGTPSLHDRILNSGPMNLVERAARLIMYQTFRSAVGIMVTSQRLEEALRNNPHLQRNGKIPHITTIRNTFPPSIDRVPPRADCNADHGVLHVLYAGKVGRAQKLGNAISAARICVERGIPIQLCIVGKGAAFDSVRRSAVDLRDHVTFCEHVELDELDRFYQWADTCLVHLTSWEPFERTVPSKTYELMELGKHISAVVQGETAQIIIEKGAGHAVSPEDPQALANLWENLVKYPSLLTPEPAAKQWVLQERLVSNPERFLDFIAALTPNQHQ
ncbi:glycosyltransferase family 4 protein [Corynebacterium resistens]